MKGFIALFKFGIQRRIKDSFLIGYGVFFPLIIIAILGYMAINYYSGGNGVTSFYYYTLVSIPFCTFLVSVTMIYVAREESNFKCGERFIIAPVSKTAIVLSKIAPSTLATTFYNCILLLICKFIFKVGYCGKFLEILLLLFVLAFMSCAIGTFIGIGTKDFMTIKNLVSTPILIMGLLGGAFFPVASLGKNIEIISYISPLTWVNKGIFNMINDGSMKIYLVALVITFILGIIFTFGAVKKFRKEAFI